MTSNIDVYGFLTVNGKKIVNESGQEVILKGWGLGNWLLPEGYMWLSYNNQRFDRPTRMENVIVELTGKEYAKNFWKLFREHYISELDIKALRDLGYNSVRIPINWKVFMEDDEDIVFKEEGFILLDRCIDWCEKYNIYAFIDLHGAPGGQTGANIDDSYDDVPRLFIDQDKWDKGIALWEELAKRYKDRWIVGGYDLLNEPIRPSYDQTHNYDLLVDRLKEFYVEAISAIRKIDKKHIISIEGHHWATNTEVFDRLYDEQMVIHFHRYGCNPDQQALNEFIDVSNKWNVPLWLGETGENLNEWYTAFYPLCVSNGIGYNLWPFKKMDCTNSPYSINVPKDWNLFLDYLNGGAHPGYTKSREIFSEFIENIKFDNCKDNKDVTNAVLRQPNCTVLGIDFDEFPGVGLSYQYIKKHFNNTSHRSNTHMKIIEKEQTIESRFFFDCLWDNYILDLGQGEFACYTINNINHNKKLELYFNNQENTEFVIYQDGLELSSVQVTKELKNNMFTIEQLNLKKTSVIKVEVTSGSIQLEKLKFI